jgi:hypothetical protein
MQDAALNFLEVFVLERSSIKHKLTSSGLPDTLLKTGTWQWKCGNGSPPTSSKQTAFGWSFWNGSRDSSIGFGFNG